MTDTNRPLRVFLCHSSADKPAVRELYQKFQSETWIHPWLDEEELYPGQDWNLEIEKAIEETEVIIVCLSRNSITKERYVQREIRIALDYADYKPEGTLFIIPVRLEECDPPRRLRMWQYADYFEGQRERAFQRLLVSLRRRYDSLISQQRDISDSRNEQVLQRISEIESQHRDSMQAIHAYRQISKDAPDNALIRKRLVDIYFRAAQVRDVVAELDDYIKYLDSHDSGYEVIPFLEKLVKDHKDRPILKRMLATRLQYAGRKVESVELLDALGEELLNSGDKKGAIDIINQIISMKPYNVENYRSLLKKLKSEEETPKK